MKGNKFLKRLAVTTLAAAMTVGAVPASVAMTATNVLAAQNVTFEADDAATNVSGLSNSISDADKEKIKTAVEGATSSNLMSTDPTPSITVAVAGGGYTVSNFKILSATAPSMKTTASGPVLVKPMLHVQADVTTAGVTPQAKGTVTFDIEADKMTKTEQIAALKTLLATVGGTSDDASTYSNDDNSSSLNSNVKNIVASVKDTSGSALVSAASDAFTTGSPFADLKVSATQTSITKATKTAAGSEGVKVDIKATLQKGDPDWDDTWGTASDSKHDVTDSQSYTATIPKLATAGEDDTYQAKVTAALKDAAITNTDYGAAAGAHTAATNKIKAALDAVGIADDNVTVTFRNFKKATHAADGSVEVLVDDKSRNSDASTAVQYATVTIPVTHKDDVVEIEKEIHGVLSKVEKSIAADSKDISSTKTSKDDQLKDLKANIQKKVDEALAATDGGNSYASEIKKVEVSLNKYTAATDTAAGSIAGPTVSPADVGGLAITVTYNDTVTTPAGTVAGAGVVGAPSTPADAKVTYTNADAIATYKIAAVDATSITLPETSYVQVKADTDDTAATITPNFTPADTNQYVIRWDLKDTDTVTFASGQNNTASVSGGVYTLSKSGTVTTRVFTQNTGVKVVKATNAKAGDSVELTASLLDKEGLVVATVKTKVTLLKGFADVQNKHDYAYNAINYLADPEIVIKNGKAEKVAVIAGTSDTTFSPDTDVTRAQFVTFLYRLAQWDADKTTATADNASDTVTEVQLKTAKDKDDKAIFGQFPTFTDSAASTKFTDVDANAYYAKAVDWAVANGITSGKTDTTFDPNGKVTRAEAVTFMYRYFAANQSYNAADFTDVANTAYYANAVGWASSNGVTQGKTAKTFAPNDTTTRKEAAAFIYRARNWQYANIQK